MEKNLNTGDLVILLAALRAAQKLSVGDRGVVTVSSDTSEIDALRAKMQQVRETKLDARERDQVLCRFQGEEFRMGAWYFQLGSNIYGWCVGESLRCNLGGGRWSQTPHGFTLSQAIVWGCEQAKHKNVRFSFRLDELPDDVRLEVGTLVASKA